MTGFREQFKFYKRKNIPLDTSNIIDFSEYKHHQNCLKRISLSKTATHTKRLFGMTQPSEWLIYEMSNNPGLFIIKNPFTGGGQRYWIIRCLEYYTKKPNKLNIDEHKILRPDEDWWEYCEKNNNSMKEKGINMIEKLRWATFGYHHNWDTKVYSENSKSEFPNDLDFLCEYLALVLQFSNFNAQAAILNLYHFGSSLSGHRDESEINLDAPLFSLSFGQSAIFLIGGKTMEECAWPILLESGDIIVMSGESRLCYHGVPRILEAKEQVWNSNIEEKSNENCVDNFLIKDVLNKIYSTKLWEPFNSYVNKSRINLNVRQVLMPGQQQLHI